MTDLKRKVVWREAADMTVPRTTHPSVYFECDQEATAVQCVTPSHRAERQRCGESKCHEVPPN